MRPVKLEFKKDIGELMKNKSYLILVFAYTFLYGVYTALGAIVSYITKPYFDPMYNSIFASCFILCGVVSSFVIGVLIGKLRQLNLRRQDCLVQAAFDCNKLLLSAHSVSNAFHTAL